MPVQVTVAILGCFAGSAALMTAAQSEFRDLRKSLATFLMLGFFACSC
jgi:hypothetical protein